MQEGNTTVDDEMVNEEAAEYHFEQFIRRLGLDVDDDEHLEDTPARVTRSRFNEIFRGLDEDPRKHLQTAFTASSDDAGFVIVDGIQVQSMCAHHFLPFRGKAHVGYIPRDKEVGLSKLARVVDGFARRPQVQERLTTQIADAVHEELDPIATIVIVEAEHECMSLRGVQEPETMTRTSALRGKAHPDDDDYKPGIKDEFLSLVGDNA
jgi:GTP cyclohydrolase I